MLLATARRMAAAAATRQAGGAWNPELYMRFGDERTQPVVDLGRGFGALSYPASPSPRPHAAPFIPAMLVCVLTVARIPLPAASVRRVVDLGCGPGNSTEVLAQRYPETESVVGVDNSAAMLRRASEVYAHQPRWSWVEADVAAWADAPEAAGRYDVVLSNATLHWLPNHSTLLPKLWRAVAPGGVLAVQMPRNFDAPSHTLIAALAREGPWAAKLEGAREASLVHPPAFYYDVLAALAPADVALWETEYYHVLPGPESVVDWVRGTALRPFLSRLSDDEQTAFVRDYTARIADAYPVRPSGRVVFPFRRLFFVAVKPKI